METQWQPVGLSGSIDPGTSAGTRLDGADLVLWRDDGGAVHVWEDRCPHRGMRLSFGFVRGNHIACLYHGWQYDTAGQCRYIPAHPDLDVPATIKVLVYRTVEHAGMIWTTLAAEAAPFPALDDEETAIPVQSLYVDCPIAAVRAALETITLSPFSSASDAETTVNEIAPHLHAVAAGQDRLLVGLQTLDPHRTALHIAVAGIPEVYEGGGQAHFLAWAHRLRYRLEHPLEAAAPIPHLQAEMR